MILSNEPGYYREGEFGIRIENLVVVEPREIEGGERPMLGFETLTLVPIDLRLIEPKLLTGEEKSWLNAYHARGAARNSRRIWIRPGARGCRRRQRAFEFGRCATALFCIDDWKTPS